MMDVQEGFLSLGSAVHSRDESAIPQDGEGEVAVSAFCRGEIAFDEVVEFEELLHAFSLNDEVVEGRKDFEFTPGQWFPEELHGCW